MSWEWGEGKTRSQSSEGRSQSGKCVVISNGKNSMIFLREELRVISKNVIAKEAAQQRNEACLAPDRQSHEFKIACPARRTGRGRKLPRKNRRLTFQRFGTFERFKLAVHPFCLSRWERSDSGGNFFLPSQILKSTPLCVADSSPGII